MPQKTQFTPDQEQWIRDNYLKMPSRKLAIQLGVSKTVILYKLRKMGLKVPKELIAKWRAENRPLRTHVTPEQEAFIRANYLTMPVKRMCALLGMSHTLMQSRMKLWGLTVPSEIIEQRKQLGRFKLGDEPVNKGRKMEEWMSPEDIKRVKRHCFKKGNKPHNTNYDGHERIDSKDGYIYVRVSEGNYQLKHRVEWEKANGSIPDDMVLRCINGDKTDCRPSNWRLIDRVENAVLTTADRYNHPQEIVPTLILKAKIKSKLKEYEQSG